MTKFLNISVDNTLGGNSPSDETVSSQKAIKGYVDGRGLNSLSDVSIKSTPVQGQFLLYNSSTNAWENTNVQFFPTQTGNAGKFLMTNGTTISWEPATTWTYDSTTETLTIT